jgi:hypothetical protein
MPSGSHIRYVAASLALGLTLAASAPVSRAIGGRASPDGAQAIGGRDASARDKPTTARLSGRVVAADTGKPLRGAIVHVASTDTRNLNDRGRLLLADEDGRWTLTEMAPGGFTVSASKGGYLTLRYGQKRPFEPGKTIVLTAGQSFDKADVVLPRAAAIAGKLLDEFGDPVTGALVQALRYRYADGQRQLLPVAEGMDALLRGGLTDDLGNYRIHGLTPGDYYICAVFAPHGESANRLGYPPTYYPGTAIAAEARRIPLPVGQEASNITFNLLRARYATVSGTVVGSTGAPVQATLTLRTLAGWNELASLPSVNTTQGAFKIPNVPPGDYRLQVHTAAVFQNPTGVMEFGSMPISVEGEDVTGLLVATAPGAKASGRVVFEGTSEPAGKLYVRTLPMTPGASEYQMASAGVNPDSTFEARGVVGRQVFDIGTLPDKWFLKSVTHDRTDITHTGYDFQPGRHVSNIQITLSQTATTLSGTAQDDASRPVSDYTVVGFSSDNTRWGYRTRFIRSVRPDQDGRFILRGLPPDDYLVVALEYVETGQEHDPAQLEAWRPVATTVTLAEGEARTVTLKLIR